MTSFKKLKSIALLLAFVMTLCFAVGAFAEGTDGEAVVSEQIAVEAESTQVVEVAETQGDDTKEPATFAVKFVNWDDTEIVVFTMNDGDILSLPEFLNPVREGYELDCWMDINAMVEESFEFGKAVTCDLTLRAAFVEIVAAAPVEAIVPSAQDDGENTLLDDENEVADQKAGAAKGEPELVVIIIDDLEEEDEGDDELFVIDDDIVPLAGPAVVQVEREVNIYSNLGSCINENELVTLMGELVGFDGLSVTLQWQYDAGMGWTDVEGANDITFSFPANAETINNAWRLAVTING